MQRLLSLMILVLTTIVARAQFLPTFSTKDNPVWYVVQFKTGEACLADQGAGNNLKTAAKAATNPEQRWQLIGNRNGFKMMSEKGNYVGYSSKFISTTEANAATLKLYANGEYWEIQRSTSSSSMNQWGGAGEGKELGEWTAGDTNNPLSFVIASATPPTFSDGENETWYFVQFCNGGFTMESNGVNQNIKTAVVDMNDNQLWKLVGDRNSFNLVSKAGGTAYLNGSPNGGPLQPSTSKSTAFKLVETGNSTYAPNWEIHLADQSSTAAQTYPALNMFQGAAVNHNISTWSANDAGNPVQFVTPDAMEFADFCVTGSTTFQPAHKRTLWYTQPATLSGSQNPWMEYSLPIGNGQLGASLFGGVACDQILFNEKTLWSGTNVTDGNYTHYGDNVKYGSYLLFGNLYAHNLDEFGYSSKSPVKNYVRTLDLERGIGTVQFTSPDGTVDYSREYFVSNPDGAIVARYTASKAGAINLRFALESGKPGVAATTAYTANGGSFGGKLNTVSYNARFCVIPTGGTMTSGAEGVTVTGADAVTVVLVAGTDYDAYSSSYISGTASLPANIAATVEAAAAKGYDELKSTHEADFTAIMGRVGFDLGGENTMPTNQLVDQYSSASGTSPKALMLEELYYHYGRYLSISSSRGVDLPNNLQGIWCNSSTPPWHSDIHANINVQMNYWPCEAGNMSEMHERFTNYIWNMACNHPEWQKNATQVAAQKQTCGWTLFTENNIFGGGSVFQTNYVIANAWYCTHLWQHYRYTLDKDYLAQKALPAMWSCCEYWMERLVKGSDGTWECPKEYSPEHGPGAENATAHSQQLVADLFANTLEAIQILGEDKCGIGTTKIEMLKDKYAKLDKGLAIEQYTGKWGEDRIKSGDDIMREWKYSDYGVGENNHRHMSHLMCLYPFNQVTPASGALFNAAVNSMKLRGDASTGWSMGWKINLWARALNGARAHAVLHTALRHSTSYGTNQGAGGIYYNLYDSHAPFQIDGNFGACSGMMEMVLQSQTDTLQLLPALPTEWKNGEFSGLKAVGGYTVSLQWKAGKLTTATITAAHDALCPIQYSGLSGRRVTVNGTEVEYITLDNATIMVNAKAGDVIMIEMSEAASITPIPVAVRAAQASAMTIGITDGKVVVNKGTKPVNTTICDVAGRLLAATADTHIRIPSSWPALLVVNSQDAAGNTVTAKLVR